MPAMACTVALTGERGRRLYGPVTGALAGLLLTLLPSVSRYAAEARPYAFACLFALLALVVLHVAVDRGGTLWWVLHAVAVALPPLTTTVVREFPGEVAGSVAAGGCWSVSP
jgi:uncharacterized membrane protein